MTRNIRVTIGPFTSPAFADGLGYLLAGAPEFEVVRVASVAELSQAVGADQPHVVLLEGTDPQAYLDLLARSPALSVILLEPEREQALVGFKKIDWQRLRRVICALAEEASKVPRPGASERLRLVHPWEDGQGPAGPVPHASADGEAGMTALCAWLDSVFARGLLPLALRDTAGSVPGWAVSARDALAGLDPALLDIDAGELDARLATQADALFEGRALLPAALRSVADVHRLGALELRILCVVLAPEIDGRYATAIGVLQDDLTRRRPGLTLIAELVPESGSAWGLRAFLMGQDSLLGRNLIGPEPDGAGRLPIEVGYAPSQAVVAALLSDGSSGDEELPGATLHHPEPVTLEPELRPALQRLRELLGSPSIAPLLHVCGNADPAWFVRLATAAGVPVARVAVTAEGSSPAAIRRALTDWALWAELQGAALVLTGLAALPREAGLVVGPQLLPFASRLPFVAVDRDAFELGLPLGSAIWRFHAPEVSATDRADCWFATAEQLDVTLSRTDAHRLGATFRLGRSAIGTCVELCAATRRADAGSRVDVFESLRSSARDMLRSELPPAIRRIDPIFKWDDIVVAENVERQLRSIPAHVIHSGRVIEQWGFADRMPYGQGVAALFSGASGTGKTMASQVIARDLGVDLFQVDLSKTISKYIGETEKNLDQVFDAAEAASAALLFDEADALFGKRTQVKDAHDRHANVEVAYLLQRMEAFRGLAVLTTNLRRNIDDAFLRRFRFAVDFAMPDAGQRAAIWARSFPSAAPLGSDLDLSFLARRLKLSGGSIQQIAIHAAFSASANDEPISMAHVVAATRQELLKVGMLNAEKTLEGLAA